MIFTFNEEFRKDYNEIFNKDPVEANMLLLLCELADEKGEVKFGEDVAKELNILMIVRFNNMEEYQL